MIQQHQYGTLEIIFRVDGKVMRGVFPKVASLSDGSWEIEYDDEPEISSLTDRVSTTPSVKHMKYVFKPLKDEKGEYGKISITDDE